MGGARLEVYLRTDDRWAWRLIGANGRDIIATDGGQGYENWDDCLAIAVALLAGRYGDAEVIVQTVPRGKETR